MRNEGCWAGVPRRTLRHWSEGDWRRLASTPLNKVEKKAVRSLVTIMVAVAHFQLGDSKRAESMIDQARDLGAREESIARAVLGGAYTSFGRAALANDSGGRSPRELLYRGAELRRFSDTHGSNARLSRWILTRRVRAQSVQGSDRHEVLVRGCLRGNGDERVDLQLTSVQTPSARPKIDVPVADSQKYWEDRYKLGGTSGAGSYGELAEFKARVINEFVRTRGVQRVIELGCGDGNQVALMDMPEYVGVDVSASVIKRCRTMFKRDPWKHFLTMEEFDYAPIVGDLSLSLDVIFHLTEESVFQDYMDKLFAASTAYCIIYSCNEGADDEDPPHVKRRVFTRWIEENCPDWRLIQILYNENPFDGDRRSTTTSFSDFYFYERKAL